MNTVFANLLTTKDLLEAFNVKSNMTIWAWRRLENDPLPTIEIPGNSRSTIRFEPGAVKQWAERNHRDFQIPS